MKKFIIFSLLIACGDATIEAEVGDEDCMPHSELYSHSVVYCGGEEVDNISNVFVACNSRVRHSERREGCVPDLALKVISEDECITRNVCFLKDWE